MGRIPVQTKKTNNKRSISGSVVVVIVIKKQKQNNRYKICNDETSELFYIINI